MRMAGALATFALAAEQFSKVPVLTAYLVVVRAEVTPRLKTLISNMMCDCCDNHPEVALNIRIYSREIHDQIVRTSHLHLPHID